MLKTIIMALLIFFGMVAYDSMSGDVKPAAPPAQQSQETNEARAIRKQEKSRAMALFVSLLPEKSTWPSPVQKFYLAFNMDEVVDPIRGKADWTPLKNMNQDLPRALIAIEDHDFYRHGAISMDSILRALLVNLTAGEVVQGGSTISQQFVKNNFLSSEQSMERKIEEALLSLMLEENYTKDEILELYLNTAYFGAGATGVKAACQKYFGKAPSAIGLAEAAVLAALPYAPSALNPLENPADCKKRQLLVLEAMHKYGMINQSQLAEARAASVRLSNGTRL